jgi:flagellin
MINLAEGAMDQFTAMLTRMKELATQSSNGIYSSSDRANLNKEFEALRGEIQRIADVTKYNGEEVLGSGAATVKYQVGDTSTDLIEVGFKNIDATQIGAVAATSALTDTATKTSSVTNQLQTQRLQLDTTAITTADAGSVFSIEVNGKSYNVDYANVSTDNQTNLETTMANLAALIQEDNKTADTGFTIKAQYEHTVDSNATPVVKTLKDLGTAVGATPAAATGNVVISIVGATPNATLNVGDLKVYAGAGVPASDLASQTITSASSARTAMQSVDQAIKDVDTYRSDLGAKSNQLEHTASNLMTRVQYTSAAASRIMDADYAVESANLAKAQVLQQAGTAMLAQANASTQNVLSLLK